MRNVYGDFSRYYDLLGWNLFARVCAERLKAFFRLRGEKPGNILNLACGTGELEKLLRPARVSFTGVDASPGMLKVARQKCPEARFVRGDAAEVRLDEKFDMVLFLFDSANHILSPAHLFKIFKNARRHLKNDGYFIFDLITPKGLGGWNETDIRRTDKYTVIVTGTYDSEEMIAEIMIEAFIKEGKIYKRTTQLITERAYETSEIFDGLIKAKLDRIVVTPFDTALELEDSERLWFVCS